MEKKLIDYWDNFSKSDLDFILGKMKEVSKKEVEAATLPFVTCQDVVIVMRREMVSCEQILGLLHASLKGGHSKVGDLMPEVRKAKQSNTKAASIISKLGLDTHYKVCKDECSRNIHLSDSKLFKIYQRRYGASFYLRHNFSADDPGMGLIHLKQIRANFWQVTSSAKSLDKATEWLSDICSK